MTPALGAKPLDVPPTLVQPIGEIGLPGGERVDGAFRWIAVDPVETYRRHLPTELYFRGLMDVDLGSDDAVFLFSSTHGITHDCASGWSDLGLTVVHGTAWSPAARRVQSAVMQFLEAHPVELGDQSWHERRVYHVDELRFRLARIRNLARTCSYLDGVIDRSDLVALWDVGLDEVPCDREGAREFVCRCLTHAMSSIHPALTVSDEAGDSQSASLFSALALQIYNDIVAGVRFRKCPRCGRLFVRHRSGRSDEDEQYQLKGDEKAVRFCAKKCSEAAASQHYRHREKARSLRDSGLTVAQTAQRMGLAKRDVELLLQAEGRARSRKTPG